VDLFPVLRTTRRASHGGRGADGSVSAAGSGCAAGFDGRGRRYGSATGYDGHWLRNFDGKVYTYVEYRLQHDTL
jgi:hypothetical protein